MMLVSSTSYASFINGGNYTSNSQENFWINNDLSLDILRLSWADTLGEGMYQQKSLVEVENFVANNNDGWRWATVSEFTDIVNWFDTDANNAGWSELQNAGTNLFVELNNFGSKYFGSSAQGDVYQNGFDHEGYTYWQFGTMALGVFESTWVADFGDQFSSVECPIWSIHCKDFGHQGYLDIDTQWGWTTYAMGLSDYNVAPLLVRGTSETAVAVPEPGGIMLAFLGIMGIARKRLSW